MTAKADSGTDTGRMYRRPAAPEPSDVPTEEATIVSPARISDEEPKPPVPVVQNAGYCSCCRNQTEFVSHDAWLRDFYICTRCGSVPRQRHLQTVLDENFPGWPALVIHESSPSNDFLSRLASDYSSSQYFPDVPRGEFRDGVRSEDVEALTFADESIDLFITQDVLEHVFNPDRAIAEIHRVLKPGGAHVFTAPKHRGLDVSRRRARLGADGQVDHLLPEEYHGNPIGDNKALVTWDYGYDFEQLMSEWAGAEVQAHHRLDRCTRPGRGVQRGLRHPQAPRRRAPCALGAAPWPACRARPAPPRPRPDQAQRHRAGTSHPLDRTRARPTR